MQDRGLGVVVRRGGRVRGGGGTGGGVGGRVGSRRLGGARGGSGRLLRTVTGLRIVDRDPESGGKTDQPGGIALADRPELPSLAAPVELPADDRGLLPGLRPHIEDGQRVPVGERRVEEEYPQVRHALKGVAVGGGGDDHLVHRRVQCTEVRLDGVRESLGDTALRQPPDQPGGVAGLVVEDEVLVGPHTAGGP